MRPPRFFPLPINIGTDICQISRIQAIVSGPRGSRFVDRILAPEERHMMEQRGLDVAESKNRESQSYADDLRKQAAFLAGRFAAKEAAIKAHSHRRLTFHDVIIEPRRNLLPEVSGSRLGSGPPVARIKGKTEADEDETAMVSISHDGDYATAVVLAHDPSVTRAPEA